VIAMNRASIHENWKDFYLAALREPHKSKLPSRIAKAENIISARARELCNSGDHNTVERGALNIALFVLAALRSSLKWDDDSSESAVA
jgi:hypothetical protein